MLQENIGQMINTCGFSESNVHEKNHLDDYLAIELEKFTLNPLGVLEPEFCNPSLPFITGCLSESKF